MLDRLVAAVDARSGDRLLVILNGVGATTLMELFIVYRAVHACLRQRGIEPVAPRIGEYLDGPGDGRVPDVRRQDGRRIDPLVERSVRHTLFHGAMKLQNRSERCPGT